MRAFKIVLVILLVIAVVLVAGVYVFLKTVDLNRFKAKITQRIGEAIGREVDLRHVAFDFSLLRGITLHVSGLSIKDSSAFSTEPMIYIDSSHLDVDILSFLIKRQVMVSSVALDSPKVHVVRDEEGRINIQEIGNPQQGVPAGKEADVPSVAKGSVEPAAVRREKSNEGFDFRGMLIRSIRVTDGALILVDRTVNPTVTIPVTDIVFEVDNLSLAAAFPVRLEASLFSDRVNIRGNGVARINLDGPQVRIDDLKIKTDLGDLNTDKVLAGLPMLKEYGITGKFRGQCELDIQQVVFGEKGLLVLSSVGHMSGVAIPVKASPVPIEALDVEIAVTDTDIELREARLPVASGVLRVTGRLVDYLSDQKFSSDVTLTGAELSEIAAQANLPVKLEGQVQVSFQLNGRGLDQDALKTQLTGNGTSGIENGRVLDVNLLKLVLSKIAFIPNLVEKIEANLPERYKEKLKAKDTILEKVEMDTKVRDGAVVINQARVIADGFEVIAGGKLDLDQNLELSADLYIPAELSKSMVTAVEDMKYFLDKNGRVHIPLRPYKGKLEKFRTYPDVEDLGKEILRNRGREELKKVLFKALDIDEQADGTPAPEGTGTKGTPEGTIQEDPAPQREPSPEEVIIENIFDMIPIFKEN